MPVYKVNIAKKLKPTFKTPSDVANKTMVIRICQSYSICKLS